MTLRLALIALVFALVACASSRSRPRHSLECRDRIDDCMDDCAGNPAMQDACFASCRTKTRCD